MAPTRPCEEGGPVGLLSIIVEKVTWFQLRLDIRSSQRPGNDAVCLGVAALSTLAVSAGEAMMGQNIHLSTANTGVTTDKGGAQPEARADTKLSV